MHGLNSYISSSRHPADEPQGGDLLSLRLVKDRGADDRYLLRTASGRYLRMAPSAYLLLLSRGSGASFEEIAASMNSGKSNKATQPKEVEQAYRIVVARVRKIEQQDSLTRSGFWLRLPLIPEIAVNKLASCLAPLFRPRVAAGLLVLIFMAALVFPLGGVSLQFSNGSLILGYLLMLGSLVLHEFGHASACAAFGARPRSIGFGVYLIYPVFYTDVSAAWELERWQRVVVDMGGLFFQIGIGALYAVLYVWLEWDSLMAAILMISGSCVFSLNPIFKFDGYWMIADALDVPNLSRQPTRLVRHLWCRLRGAETEPLPWKSWITTILTFYSALSFAVWGFFIWFALPFFGERILTYPVKVLRFLEALSTGGSTGSSASPGDFFVSTYTFVLAVIVVSRMSRGLSSNALVLIRKSVMALRSVQHR